MSDLTSIEKLKIEKLFGMESGYVLDFSNRTFFEFILDNTGLNINDEKYDYGSGSKANRLRAFWAEEPNYIVGQLLSDLLEYFKAIRETNGREITQAETVLLDECNKIAERLKLDTPIDHIDAIKDNIVDQDFSLLAKSIRDSIQKNEPEAALDRLHTYFIKFLRHLFDKYGIQYDRDRPLHSLFGEYIKYLKQQDLIESPMTEKILKASIVVLECFNDVRNNKSLAHDNPILNYRESILIFSHIVSMIKFIQLIEDEIDQNKSKNDQDESYRNEIPF
jgi:hypothetical protein